MSSESNHTSRSLHDEAGDLWQELIVNASITTLSSCWRVPTSRISVLLPLNNSLSAVFQAFNSAMQEPPQCSKMHLGGTTLIIAYCPRSSVPLVSGTS